jgi:hypothetical protein
MRYFGRTVPGGSCIKEVGEVMSLIEQINQEGAK